MAHRFHLVEQFNIEKRLERIRVPTLVLSGDRDLLVSERNLEHLCQGIHQSELVRLRGCGHLAFVMEPRRVADEVYRFLR
ncbi:MAG TPA: alpha/beta hydrolase, partial [Gemmataceae bacterium]|nr:alpha/beta hydrolase [Gemmataceae bacterium]